MPEPGGANEQFIGIKAIAHRRHMPIPTLVFLEASLPLLTLTGLGFAMLGFTLDPTFNSPLRSI